MAPMAFTAVLAASSVLGALAQGTSTRTAAVATAAPAASSSAAAGGAGGCYSGYAATPLASKHFAYPSGIPYKVTTDTNICRGGQVGYNICNSTTEGQTSMCQTSFINSIDDFCLWGPPEPNSLVADTEGEMVAWCTKPGRGTRLIPAGALQGVQFLRAPAYVEVVGFIDQSKINMQGDDSGGEMDPHGADGQGNPMGGLMYSQAFGANKAWSQVIEWHNFLGGGLKACDPSGADAANYCQHIYDRIGCTYNAPAAYVNGTFESCASDNQMFPGVYVGANGATSTYTQPAESLGAISTMPYQPVVPKSSQCTPYTSAQLFSALGSVTVSSSSTRATTTTGTATGTGTTARPTTSGTTSRAALSTSASTTSDASPAARAGVVGAVGLALFVGLGAML